jgi:PAS domain S-box-containing protein
MRHWISRLTDPEHFRPRFPLVTAISVTVVFFAVIAANIWLAQREVNRANRDLLAVEQSVGNIIDLHARRIHSLFESVSRPSRLAEDNYRRTAADLDRLLLAFHDVPYSKLIAGDLSASLHAHAWLKTLENQALDRMAAGDADSAMAILFSLQRIQAEDDFHNGIHAADQTLSRQRDALASRFSNRLLLLTVITSGFILLLTGGWIAIVFLTRKYFRAHAQAQTALQESEIKYRGLIDALPYGVMIVQDMIIQFGNPALSAMIGNARADELTGVPLESILAEKDRVRVRMIAAIREQGAQDVPDHYFVTGLRSNQDEFPAEVYVRPIQYSGRYAAQAVIMDITDRRRAEDALRESEERFRNLADLAPVLIWMAGVKRHTFYLNRTWLNFTGHGVGQEYGQGWQQGVHPEDLPRVQHSYDSAFASRSPFTVEYRLRHADGTYHWVLDTGVPRFTSEHQFTGYIGSCVDISARLEAEQALRDNEERFRTLYNKTPAMLHSIDKQGRIVSVSDYWLDVMGYERNEVIGKSFMDFLTPEFRRLAVEKSFPESLVKGDVKNVPLPFTTKSGRVIDTILSAVAEHDSTGNFVRLLTVNVDVTELRRAEVALRTQARIIDEIHDGIVTTDMDAYITSWNKGAERLYGYRADEVIGKHISLLYPDPKALDTDVVTPLLRDGSHATEVRLKRKSGEEFDVQLYLSCSYDTNGNLQGMIGYSRDITERKRTEQAIQESNKKLLRAQHIAKMGFLTWNLKTNDMHWSDEIYHLYGLDPQMQQATVDLTVSMVHPDDLELAKGSLERALQGISEHDIDHRILRPDGHVVWVHSQGELIRDADGTPSYFLGTHIDITERKRVEAALHQVNRALKTISDCNQALVRNDDESALLQEICRIIVETGGYRFAWVGLPGNDDEKTIERAAFAGQDDEFLDELCVTWSETPGGQGPVCSVLRTGQMQVIRDIMIGNESAPWRKAALKRGFRSAIGLPLIAGGDILGALGIFAHEPDSFPESETDLLRELADDLAYGMSALCVRREHERASQALIESEEQFRTLFETMEQGVVYQDRSGRIISANPNAERILGLSLAEMNGLMSTDPVWGAVREDGTPFPGEMHPSMVALLTGVPVHSIVMGVINRCEEQIHWIEVDAVPQFRPGDDVPYRVYTVFSDITERKQAEEALRQSEERFRTAFFTSPDAVNISRISDGVFVDVNDGFTQITGYSRDFIIGKSTLEINLWDDLKDRQRLIDGLRAHGAVSNLEAKFRFKDDVIHTCLMSARVLMLSGEPHMLSVVRDIEEMKQAQEKLRQSEELYRLLADNANDLISRHDAEAKFLYVSPACSSLLGYLPEDLLGKSALEIIHPEDQQRIIELHQRNLTGQPTTPVEYRVLCKDGRYIWFECSSSGVLREDGSFAEVIVVNRDITFRKHVEEERQRVETALRLSEERFSKAFSASPIAIAVTRMSDGRILEANAAAGKFFEYSPGEVIGLTTQDLGLWNHLEDRSQILNDIAAGKSVRDREYPFVTKKGLSVAARYSAELIELNNEPCLLSVFVDITEQKRAEEMLRVQRWRLESIIESTDVGTWEWNVQTGETVFNETWARIAGYTLEELSPVSIKTWEALAHPDDLKQSNELLERHFSGEMPYYDYECRIKHKDGRWIWIHDRGRVITRTADGKPLMMFGTHADITERKQAEEALRLSEERFRAAFFTSPDAVNINRLDDGLYVDINEGFTHTTGYAREEVIGKSSLEINVWANPEDRDRLITGLRERGVVNNLEAKFRMKDGSVRTGLMSARVLILNGEPHILSITRDIEEMKFAQEKLRQSEQRFRELFNNMASGVAVYEAVDDGQDFIIKDFNRSGQRIEKTSAEEAIGRRVTEVFPGVEDFGILEIFQRVWRTGQPEHFPVGFYQDEKISGWRENYIYKLPTGEVVAVYDDVTERKQAEEALLAKTEELDRFFDVNLDLLCIANTNGYFLHVNRAWETTLGYSLEDLEGKRFFDFIHPDDVESTQEAVSQLAAGNDVISFVNRYRCRDGSYRWIEWRSTPHEGGIIYAAARDITERRITEEALRQSEERFRTLVEATPFSVTITRKEDGTVMYINDGGCHVFGRSREDLIGHRTTDLFRPDYDRVNTMAKLDKEGSVQDVELSFYTPDGALHYVSVSMRKMVLGGEEVVLSAALDISGRKQAETALHNANEALRAVIDASPLAITTLNSDGIITSWNKASERIFGWTADEVIGKVNPIVPTDKREEFHTNLEILRRGGSVFGAEMTRMHKDGSLFEMRLSAAPLHDPAGQITGILAIQEDITEARKIQQELQERQGKLDSIFRAAPVGIGVVVDRVFTDANDMLCDITGYSREELIGQSARIIYPTDEDYEYVGREKYRQIAEKGTGTVETRWRRKDGSVIYVLLSSSPIIPEDLSQGVTFTALDITERKRAEEELERRATELQRSNAELERFAYIASHDLQEPLRMMASYAQLLEQRYQGRLDTDADEFIGFITDGAERMRQLIRDLLMFSRVDTRAKPFHKVDCQTIFEKVLTDLRVAIAEAQATVTAEPLPTLIADDTQLSQLLRNLISNAIKFRASAPPEVHIAAAETDGHWQFSVRDNGIGIDPKYSDQVFVIFKRLHGRTEYPGTGIGLAVCKKIVERHGGRIWVESTPGHGTTFFFTIPKQRPAEGRIPKDGR